MYLNICNYLNIKMDITLYRKIKVCYVYANPKEPYEDLSQEILTNLWLCLNHFRGTSKTVNLCLSGSGKLIPWTVWDFNNLTATK